MFQNHLKIAWRQLGKNKFITSINLLGLVMGMMAALFIWQYVTFERSYDRFHSKADRIFRVRTDRMQDGEAFMQFAAGAAFAGPIVADNFSEVEKLTKLKESSEKVFSVNGENSIREKKNAYAQSSLFEVFDFELLAGDTETCLDEPFTVIMAASFAEKLFGNKDPLGEVLTVNGDEQFTITGIYADFPANSHLKFKVLLSYSTYSEVYVDDGSTETAPYWDGFFSYLLLRPDADWKALEAKIPAAIEANYDEEVRENVELYLQPLTDIHLKSNYLFEAEVNGDGPAVSFLSIIGFIVLIIAWLNYINLSVARSLKRAKEVGVRKVAGSSRQQIVVQFLTETGLMNGIAILLALAGVFALHPLFETLAGKEVPLTLLQSPQFYLVLLGVLTVGTLLSGLYPAFLLSSFRPMEALKTTLSSGGKQRVGILQRSLVVIQFMGAIGLIAGTLVINQQLSYLQNKQLGVNIDQTLVLKGPEAVDSTFLQKGPLLKEELQKIGTVSELAASTAVPGQPFGWTAGGIERVGSDIETPEGFHVMAATRNYSEMFELELVAGRHMEEEMGSDRLACIVNETALKQLRFNNAEEAINTDITFWGDQFTIVGVAKDFHQESPKSKVEPMILRYMPDDWVPSYYALKVNTADLTNTLGQANALWSQVLPGNPFEYFFLDDHFQAQYEADQRFKRLFTLFSVLAIIVACLGLFALVAFIAERRRKEIGIRKVLGASVGGIVQLLSKQFIALLLIAIVIATPLTWYFMNSWLDNFANRTTLSIWVFLMAGGITLVIAFATMSFQSLKAALVNPVEAIRTE